MPQKMMAAFALPYARATSRIVCAGTPQIGSATSGVNVRMLSRSASKPVVKSRT